MENQFTNELTSFKLNTVWAVLSTLISSKLSASFRKAPSMDTTLEQAQYSGAQYTINMNVEELYVVR
jgi:hypothetical protein